MARYVTIYRWKPGTAHAFAKKWLNFMPGYPGPQKLKDAAAKFKNGTMAFSVANNCVVFIYDLADEDWVEANTCGLHLVDVCTMETFPVLTPEDHSKSFDMFGEMFPKLMEEMTKE
ncbi:MAG: hypothetical protein JW839_20990 [Candidatus Lokiarchaeota archaeon]|nr:hypothetical protein [Candidatus Lokiarchaeota archaeon]